MLKTSRCLLLVATSTICPSALLAAPPPATEPPVTLAPFVVRELRPLLKIAEHPIVEPRYGAAVVAAGDYLYIIGGSNSEGVRLDTIERIDLRTGQATAWGKLRIARRHHRAVLLDGKIYVLGGTSGPPSISSASPLFNQLTEELPEYYGEDPALLHSGFSGPKLQEDDPSDILDNTEDAARRPQPVSPPPYHYEASMEIVDLQTGASRFGPEMPFAKALFGCVAIDGRILVIGGQKMKGATLSRPTPSRSSIRPSRLGVPA